MSATASTAATAVRTPAPLIWPERDNHTLTGVDLDPQLPKSVEALLPQLRQLAALGDALRALQAIDGTFVHEGHARTLAKASAELMEELADSDAISAEQADMLRRRAAALVELRHDTGDRARRSGAHDAADLTVIAGPMCTFRNKTRTPLHSVVACTAHEQGDQLIAALDASSGTVLEEVNGYCGTPDVTVGGIFAMQVTDLIAMGGESNAFPKHFAYFLPEDEGAGYGEVFNKTILFRNVYGLRYEYISKPLGDALLKGYRAEPQRRRARRPRHLDARARHRARGHHAARRARGAEGRRPRAVVRAAGGDSGRVRERDVVHRHVARAGRLLARRHGRRLPRRGAALPAPPPAQLGRRRRRLGRAELPRTHGAIDVHPDGTISWETEKVVKGVHKLCAALERDVVSAPGALRCSACSTRTAGARTACSRRRCARSATSLAACRPRSPTSTLGARR